jgi:hypothetical protein
LVSNDAALAGISPDRFFALHFGLDKERWRMQPTVSTIEYRSDCSAALTAAIAAAPDIPLIWVEGDLVLSRPLTLGTEQHPVVIVVNGSSRFEGAINLNGVIYSKAMTWNGSGEPGSIHGAAIVETTYRGTAAPEFAYDTKVLGAITANSGSFARVNGSWRDF